MKLTRTHLQLLSIAGLSLSLIGCADPNAARNSIKPKDLPQMAYSNVKKSNIDGVSPIRYQALKEVAMQLGAQGALAYRAKDIDQSLEVQAKSLDQIYNFNAMLLSNNVLPPVLSEASDSLHLDNVHAIRAASHTYRIIANAQFVTTAPTWRTYLEMNYSKPDLPSNSSLPHTPAETKAWNKFMKQGWAQGLQQANDIFTTDLNRLKRDFKGMILYRKLLAQNMVSAPFVAKANLGVTGDANELRINDRVLRITAISKLNTNASSWKPVITTS